MLADDAIDYARNARFKRKRNVEEQRWENIRAVNEGGPFLPDPLSALNSTIDRNPYPIPIQDIEIGNRLGWVRDRTVLKLSQDALDAFGVSGRMLEELKEVRFEYKGPVIDAFGPTSEVKVQPQDMLIDQVMKLLGFDVNRQRTMSAMQLEPAEPADLPSERRMRRQSIGIQTDPQYGYRSTYAQTEQPGASTDLPIVL